MCVADQRNFLLKLPAQIGDIAHRMGDEHPARDNTHGQREGGAQEDASISGDDTARHGRDEYVYYPGKELFTCLAGWCKGGYGVGEGCFFVENIRHEAVDAVFGSQRLFI